MHCNRKPPFPPTLSCLVCRRKIVEVSSCFALFILGLCCCCCCCAAREPLLQNITRGGGKSRTLSSDATTCKFCMCIEASGASVNRRAEVPKANGEGGESLLERNAGWRTQPKSSCPPHYCLLKFSTSRFAIQEYAEPSTQDRPVTCSSSAVAASARPSEPAPCYSISSSTVALVVRSLPPPPQLPG